MKLKLFSLDRHVDPGFAFWKNCGFFSSVCSAVFRIPKRPVLSLAEAKTAWGIQDFSLREIKGFAIRRLASGIFSGIIFCLLVFLVFYNLWHDSFGILSGIEYTLALLGSACISTVCLWQSDMLGSDKFVPYHEYIIKWKWLFACFIVVFFCQAQLVMALPDTPSIGGYSVDLPDTRVQNTTDLSSVFIGHIIGGPWRNYIDGNIFNIADILFGEGLSDTVTQNVDGMGSMLPGSISPLLLVILGCLNTGALIFVSGFAVYIFTFGSVQVAHTGDWKDSQIFSTFWSPVRTVAAIALCSPVTNGISLLHHLILVAIAMSINLANNISVQFTDYIQNDRSLYHLDVPVVSTGRDHFSKLFSVILNGVMFQVMGTNIHGAELIPDSTAPGTLIQRVTVTDANGNRKSVTGLFAKNSFVNLSTANANHGSSANLWQQQNQSSTVGRKYQTTITFAKPGSFYSQNMPRIVLSDESNWKMTGVYTSAIFSMYESLYRMTDKYIAKNIQNRKNTEGMDEELKSIYTNFINTITNGTQWDGRL